MVCLDDAYRAFAARGCIVDGDVVIAHFEDQHVFVFDRLTIRGQQQTEVVEHRTFVAALILVVGSSLNLQLHLGSSGTDRAHLELGNPVFLLP